MLALDDLTRGIPEIQARFPYAGVISIVSELSALLLIFVAGAAAGASISEGGGEFNRLVARGISIACAASIPILVVMPLIFYLRAVGALFQGLPVSSTSSAARRGFWAVLVAALVTPLLLLAGRFTGHAIFFVGIAIGPQFVAAIFVAVALRSLHRDAGSLLRGRQFVDSDF